MVRRRLIVLILLASLGIQLGRVLLIDGPLLLMPSSILRTISEASIGRDLTRNEGLARVHYV